MSALVDFMRHDLDAGPQPEGLDRLVAALREQFGNAMQAVVMYGSCRRKLDAAEGLVDLLVVVSGYRQASGAGLLATLNWLLPPNVFYLEVRQGDKVLRCKYAVISQAQFLRRCSSRMDHYFWARFCQPARLAYEHDHAGDVLALGRARAARSFAQRVAPLVEQPISAHDFWARALSLTYRCELRPEPAGNADRLIAADPDYWPQLSKVLEGEADNGLEHSDQGLSGTASSLQRFNTRLSWQLRRVSGKLFNLARLFKAAGTFTNGIDYIVWKVERHSGVRVEPTERMRRYPRLAAWGLAWRMWRQGGFR
jgi:hypothetical protein